jgi:hypothetical protein
MGEESRKILEMLAAGKINADEAEKLLSAISEGKTADEEPGSVSSSTKGKKTGLKYLRIVVEPGSDQGSGDRVNIRVPLKLVRTGLKWASFIPKDARSQVNEALKEKGIDMDFTHMTKEDMDELIENLNDLTVDVEGEEKVRIFCE